MGRNRLVSELLRAGIEVARPERDRGIDLIAYLDMDSNAGTFVAIPIQMKASMKRGFLVDQKYAKFPGLVLTYVWDISGPMPKTLALTYDDAVRIAEKKGWTSTSSWKKGRYSTPAPDRELISLLQPHLMDDARWRDLVRRAGRAMASAYTGVVPEA